MANPVEDLLKKQGVYYTYSGQDLLVKCFNPEHPDKNPSMRIDKMEGKFHCFGCNFKGNIFKHFGVLTSFSSIKILKLKEKLKNLSILANGVEPPPNSQPYHKEFRRISLKTLKHFGVLTATDKEEQTRIYLPVTDVRNKAVVYVGRHVLTNGNPRYINYPAGVEMPCFPVLLEQGFKSIVLVEGVFDMLNLWDKGIHNVVCTFGTNTLSKDIGTKLLPYKTQGINKIFIMFDGDDAGNAAAAKLKPVIEELGYLVEVIPLEDGDDPGDMDQENVTIVKEYINA